MPVFKLDPNDEVVHYISYTLSKYRNYETVERQIPTRDVTRMIFPKDCTSFELYDRIFRHNETYDIIYVGEVVNRSQYYIGKVYSLDELGKEVGTSSPTYKDFADSDYDKIVKIYGDEFISVASDDHVILPSRVKFANNFDVAPAPTQPTMTR